MENQSGLSRITSRIIIATFIVVVMIVGKSFLIPLAWALLIGMASYPMLEKLEKRTRLPRSLINALFLLLLLFSLLGIGIFFYKELNHIFKEMPALAGILADRVHNISARLESAGIQLPENIDKSFISNWISQHSNIVLNILSGIGGNIWNIILIIFYMFFLLHYRDLVFTFFARKYTDPKKLIAVRNQFHQSNEIVRSYLYGLLLLTLVSGVMNYIVFLLFGLKFALFFGIFLAVLNLIPFIGNPIGLLTIFIYAAITHDTLFTPLMIIATMFVVNFLQDNLVRTWLMGDKMKLNAFAIFVSIIIGGMIWGVSGMILFIPITGIIKIVLENRKETEHYAIIFSELPSKPKAPVDKKDDE